MDGPHIPQDQTPPEPQEFNVPQPLPDAQFVEPHKTTLSLSKYMKLGVMALLVLAIPISYVAVKNSTDNRSRAAEMVMTPPNPTDTPTPTPGCQPRPACLDSKPRCYIPEPASGWCKPTPTCDPRKVGGCGLMKTNSAPAKSPASNR